MQITCYLKYSIEHNVWREKLREKFWVLDENWTGVGGLSYKSDRDAHQKIKITPLRETNVGVGQA